jgi:ribulose-5-phosphate 4-epimerase/fuculose-1-phosphate aldolase
LIGSLIVFTDEQIEKSRPRRYGAREWRARLELAACYRVFAHNGWAEEIFNHITLRVPDAARHFLINPFGLNYSEVTANNLIKIDIDGRPVEPTDYGVNRAGFVIHAAVHGAKADAHCVVHTHNTDVLAVSCKAGGLSADNFYAAFLHERLAYHDFEGVSVHTSEQERLVRNLGDKKFMILRNHGLLVTDTDLAGAYYWTYAIQRACEVQVRAHAMPGDTIALTQHALQVSSRDGGAVDPAGQLYPKVFAAAVRRAGLTLDALL